MACRNWRLVFRCTALILVVLFFSAASRAADEPRGVVLIGWDGAQRNHVKEMLADDELPNLAAIAKEGTMVDIDVVNSETDTATGWAQILTGYIPDRTGVYSDKIYRPIPVGYTVFERLENFFGPENIETEAIISKINNYLGSEGQRMILPEEWRQKREIQSKTKIAKLKPGDLEGGKFVEENGAQFIQMPASPYLHAKERVDSFVNGLIENEKVGLRAIDQLEKCKDKRFFFFIHFAQPDLVGHKYGENSQEYSDGLKLDDLWTGKIIDKLKELKIYDKTLVYVTVDHGFDEGKKGHSYAPYVFLATNDKKVNRNGTREDVAPTVLKRFGLDLSKIEPRLDGIPLDEPAPDRKAPAEKPNPKQKQGENQ